MLIKQGEQVKGLGLIALTSPHTVYSLKWPGMLSANWSVCDLRRSFCIHVQMENDLHVHESES